MEFGRVSDPAKLDQIKWSLPALDSPEEKAQLERLDLAWADGTMSLQEVRLGLPIWGESQWSGKLFPPGTRSDHYLREYAKQFSWVEVNSTFYAIPPEETILKWVSQVPEDFIFCPKFPQSFSRSLAGPVNWMDFDVFISRARSFGKNLGMCFLQLPPEVGIESLVRLKTVFEKIPDDLKAMIEFRHPSFFQDQRLLPEVVDSLAHARLGAVITDTALYRNYAHVSLSNTRVLIRFAASNLHPSDYVRMDQWAERIGLWIKHGMRDVYVSVHGTEPVPQIKAAEYFIQKLNDRLANANPELKLPEPHFYHEDQGSLF